MPLIVQKIYMKSTSTFLFLLTRKRNQRCEYETMWAVSILVDCLGGKIVRDGSAKRRSRKLERDLLQK